MGKLGECPKGHSLFLINTIMAITAAIERQPDKLDYLSPTQFKFNIHQLPKVEFFTVSAQVPSISMGNSFSPTRLVDLPMMGDKVTFDPLQISFICDEFLENYLSIHEWITAIGFPKSTEQFKNFRTTTSATPSTTVGTSTDIGDVQPATAVRGMFSDASLTILSNKNNPVANVFFRDLYPTSLDALDFTQAATDVEYVSVSATFAYSIYEIEAIS
mgnify:FL=1